MAADYIGKEIEIHTDEGKFYGIIHSVDVQNQKIVLQKVSTSNGTKMRGLQIFFTKEIQYLQLMKDAKNENETYTEQTEVGKDLTGSDEIEAVPKGPENNLSVRDPSDEGSRLIARPPLAPSKVLAGDDDFISTSREDPLSDPPAVMMVDKFDENYIEALENINKQRVVGLSAEGNKIGRSGTLCLLVVGCRQVTYIFDVYQLGEDCFSNGLKSFLENGCILKVIHDCRLLSDCLFHKYDITLANIFDTQVADIMIYKQNRGKLPGDVNGIEPCLYEYLHLHRSQCTFLSVLHQSRKKNQNVWTDRPLSTKLLNAVAGKVLYLRELRIAQMENMMAEFLFGVNVYLGVFRDSDIDHSIQTSKNIRVPDQFYGLKNVSKKRWQNFKEKDRKAALAEERLPGDESKVYNNPEDDVGWTEGNSFADMYNKKHGKILERDDLDHRAVITNGTQVIDTDIAPWRSAGTNTWKIESRDTSTNNVILRSEASRSRKSGEKKGNVNNSEKLTEQHHDNLEVSSSTEKGENSTDILAGPLWKQKPLDRNGSSNAAPLSENSSSLLNDNNNFIDQEVKGKEIAAGMNNSEVVLQNTPEKHPKIPVDWFDYDTPSSDRSRASSFGSDTNVASSYHRSQWQKTVYDEDFPMLNSVSQKSNAEGGNSYDSGSQRNVSSNPEAAMVTKAKSDSLRGVTGTPTKPLSLGRAKSRAYFAARSTLAGSPMCDEMPRPGSIGGKNTMDFPHDDDLLQTNPILKADLASPVLGRNIKIHKITPK